MKVLLLANFPGDRQESMLRFGRMLADGLPALGCTPELLAPPPVLTRFTRYRYGGLPKFLGYADKFFFFPRHLRRHLARTRPDVVHVVDHANAVYTRTTAAHAPSLITCHDLLQIRAARGEFAQQRLGAGGRRFQGWIARQLAAVPFAVCVSEKTRQDLHQIVGLPPERTSVVPNGLNHPYRRVSPAVARARLAAADGTVPPWLDAPGGFFLSVSGRQWYKNRPGLLATFAALHRQLQPAPLLVMTGKPLRDTEQALITRERLETAVIAQPGVDNDRLEALYSLARGLIFPSWEEGFGWPIAEAMSCGCPVFTSDRAPMTEVGAGAAVFIPPDDPARAAQLIVAAQPERETLSAAGLAVAPRFTATRMLEGYVAVYRRLIAGGFASAAPAPATAVLRS